MPGAIALGVQASCLTPPALFPSGPVDLEACLRKAPSGTERVELASDKRVLRGVFVPAGEEAPVVLHLMSSGQSVASTVGSTHRLFERLASMGFASLAVDYGGVGVSEGDRDVRHLGEDALAMWHEAVRRAGGDSRRVVLRCTSIGGIAAAELLDAGATPRSVIWIAPVSPRTAVRRAIARTAGGIPAALVSWAFAPISRTEPIEALAKASPSVLIISSANDTFLDSAYLERFKAFAAADGCTFVEEFDAEHEWLAVSSLNLDVQEGLWLAELEATDREVPEPRSTEARWLWASDSAVRQRYEKLARLAPGLSSEELIAAARLEDLELALFQVWLRGTRRSPEASLEDLSQSYRGLENHAPENLWIYKTFNLLAGTSSFRDLEGAARALCSWDGQSPLELHWRLEGGSATLTLKPLDSLQGELPLPDGSSSQRAWFLEAMARGVGMLMTRKPEADGTPGVYFLDDMGNWVALGCDDSVDVLAHRKP